MRCHEARQEIERLACESPARPGRELSEHFKSCPACARLWDAERILAHELETARADSPETADCTPLLKMQTAIRLKVQASSKANRGQTTMARLIYPFTRRPRLSLSLGAVAVLFAAMMLVPFSIDRPSGYEVAVAGINPDLALNEERMGQLLNALEMDEASFEVAECDPTCKVVIRDLSSHDDARVVAAAFGRMEDCKVEYLTQCSESEKTTLFKAAKVRFASVTHSEDLNVLSEDEVDHKVVCAINELDGTMSLSFSVFEMEGENIAITPNAIGVFGDSGHVEFIEQMAAQCAVGPCGSAQLCVMPDGGGRIVVVDKDGNRFEYDADDPAAEAKLKEMGLNVCFSIGEDSLAGDEAAAKPGDGVLPEGYLLAQNYPNPFNPTTTIEFAVPSAQHVTLEIFNMQGQKVRTLVDGVTSAGSHTVEWDSRTDAGTEAASGVYLYRLTAEDFSETKKMSLVK
jgi:hypothetical protein